MLDSDTGHVESFDDKPFPRSAVNRYDEAEVTYWTARFRCTPGELLRAIAAVGVSAWAIESYFEDA